MKEKDWLNRVYFGDCIKWLDAMPAGIVNTCITSPPYYGLRDYGSGRWEGGDASHDHAKEVGTRTFGRNDIERYGVSETFTGGLLKHIRTERPKAVMCSCGAVYVDEQIGQEETPEHYVSRLVDVFRAVRRVLRDDGTVWLNLGDSYSSQPRGNKPGDIESSNLSGGGGWQDEVPRGGIDKSRLPGIKPKDLIGIPWMVAFALRADGWYLRSDVIWNKPNPMPESITDRPTKAHEYIFLLAKSQRYFYDADAIKESAILAGHVHKLYSKTKSAARALAFGKKNPVGNEHPDAPPYTNKEMRNKRSVWTVNARPYSGAHFATYPEELIEPCVLAGSPVRGVVLDPFIGSGTTAAVAARLERYWIGCELNASNAWLQAERLGRTWTFDEAPSPRMRVRLNGEGDRVRL